MPPMADRIERARHLAEWGRFTIARQMQMVDRHRAEGRDTKLAENLSSVFQRTQEVFERDLAELERRGRRGL